MDSTNKFYQESALSLKLFIVLTRALQSVEKQVINDIKSHGVNLTEFSVLELLFNKGEQPIQKIGHKVLLASSSITYVVDKLEKKNLIRRRACPSDRRVTYAGITDDGKQLMEEIFPKHVEAMNEIMGGLNDDEKQIMIDYLKKLGYHAAELEAE
ncbi:MarR family transcriptional regulator, 2-MHQ and catechol-resistance regulon repressor [Salinibacillus kushneri]|uniref:MarR family transcriptional regulator, 2-MHQ and catechol-resistance regulon repressor n=1 Tax=Salinibacillus kushneri TaxID=237682 RepID=A0A1I0II47_9BACI|nr:MarR family transcriptional regulator [Salinibacillus kushneri]SET96064.1 MarR family transcriptional regulator, 2-MHQ and catechol-resistance regulon repressor [Salinibacillus kushneri]